MATEEATHPAPDDRPELLIKLQERKARHKQRNIVHRAAERAENATMRERIITGVVTVLAVAAFAVAAILWNIPLVPVL